MVETPAMPSSTKPSAPARSACCPAPVRAEARRFRSFAPLFRALGDATRLEMLGLLANHAGDLCACEIEAHFELSQPTVSHHLGILKRAGLVAVERRGTWNYYRLQPVLAAELRRFLALATD
jgi:ArsR family transcriptional regulator